MGALLESGGFPSAYRPPHRRTEGGLPVPIRSGGAARSPGSHFPSGGDPPSSQGKRYGVYRSLFGAIGKTVEFLHALGQGRLLNAALPKRDQNRSLAMDGRKLIRSATSWRTAKMAATNKALLQLKRVGHRKPTTKPTRLAVPTIMVNATSLGLKCPDITFAQPRRNSQMRLISTSQTMKHGSAAHFAISRWRSPSTIGNHKGRVCTMCRMTPLLTTPTMYNATNVVRAQYPTTFAAFIILDRIRGYVFWSSNILCSPPLVISFAIRYLLCSRQGYRKVVPSKPKYPRIWPARGRQPHVRPRTRAANRPPCARRSRRPNAGEGGRPVRL